MPLMYSLRDALDTYQRLQRKLFHVYKAKASSRSIEEVRLPATRSHHMEVSVELAFDVTCNYKYQLHYTRRPGFAVTRPNGELYEVKDAMEIVTRLLELETAIWELTPYSFVADWFINIGDVIENQEALYQNIEIIQGFSVESYDVKPIRAKSWFGDLTITDCRVAAPYIRRFEKSLPQVELSIDTGFNSWKHVVDSVALLFSAHRNRIRKQRKPVIETEVTIIRDENYV